MQSFVRSVDSLKFPRWFAAGLVLCFAAWGTIAHAQSTPDFEAEKWEDRVSQLSEAIIASPKNEQLYSARGDAHFFLGQFKEALVDYDKIVELVPERDSSHWRRGIALYYTSQFDKATSQFQRYHSFDQVDRENGIWRYLSQLKHSGNKVAQAELLKYEKDDREPFGDIYRLYSGEITKKELLDRIANAKVDDDEQSKRLFYASLYIGLHEDAQGRPGQAKPYLQQAALSDWGRTAGYGPNFMWHVARLHLQKLSQRESSQRSPD
ncbi:Lipoprotein NlpI precursor [Thalassoglobus neptunius]|uniref:Lipoprotein NlpI n=1 Tax=Thalassoglobus neptunius TaxID=1938619 RepID=A0A5C5VTM8_9PLAN|nr:hypothetical protein [Thalassoglobus neptunius]TWT41483.1 Lipoprotein NlpI precursor [Thalassoglobus neptunius]